MEETTLRLAESTSVGPDAVRLLQRLIRFDTTNPPGREHEAQAFLAELLSEAGMEVELLSAEPDRTNLVARLRGRAEGPTLALISHMDTVRADASEWTRDPWCGEIHDGDVWGRGALDMKDQVATEAAACAALARAGWRPDRGELLLVVTADEETGAHLGAQWLCAEHPEKVRADYVVNEGGGMRVVVGDRRLYALALGEKGVFRFRLRTRGVAGHGSLPQVGDNALLKLAPLIARLREQPDPELNPEVREFLRVVLGDGVPGNSAELPAALARVREADPLLGAYLAEPMAAVTLTPTMASASAKINVIPSRAEAMIDCRVPPPMGEADVLERVRRLIGEGDSEIEFVERVVGNRSEFRTPLSEAIGSWLERVDPDASLLPTVMPGFSDSHWWRKAFGSVVYGFCPQNAMTMAEATPLVHGADERVAAADVELGASFFYELPQMMLG